MQYFLILIQINAKWDSLKSLQIECWCNVSITLTLQLKTSYKISSRLAGLDIVIIKPHLLIVQLGQHQNVINYHVKSTHIMCYDFRGGKWLVRLHMRYDAILYTANHLSLYLSWFTMVPIYGPISQSAVWCALVTVLQQILSLCVPCVQLSQPILYDIIHAHWQKLFPALYNLHL